MITISENVLKDYSRQGEQEYVRKLAAWIASRPELASSWHHATPEWCMQTLHAARSFHIESEDDVARLARLRLVRGDEWLKAPDAQEILTSSRHGQLKAFQLECLHAGAARG